MLEGVFMDWCFIHPECCIKDNKDFLHQFKCFADDKCTFFGYCDADKNE